MSTPAVESRVCPPPAVRSLLEAEGLDPADLRFLARSATAVDTGRWLRSERIWAAVAGDRLVLVAPGPRPFRRVLPASALTKARFNHVTGGLVFPAAGGEAGLAGGIPPLALDPLVARSLISLDGFPPPPPPGALPDA
jgi:hypothetical protein